MYLLTLISIRDRARIALKISNPPTPSNMRVRRPARSIWNADTKVITTLTPPVAMVAYSALCALKTAVLNIKSPGR